ncbi:hypothetical protein [Oceanobacillus damuensis]|uniref:hypothetical protein n=1 Tax=Oceanobacillus damuensis TaxID=937928 RepID=UPI000836D7B5|nr:hypothetical protein [Oceanobacillus damuensis]
MNKIRCLKDFKLISSKIDSDFLAYLKQEFYGLYEYLSNGEGLREFKLHYHQAIVIFESKEEINQLLESDEEVEFTEEVQLKSCSIQRIGIYHSEDVQLCFYINDGKIST